MNDDRQMLDELLRLVELTADHEIDCEEFLHRSAGLVEALETPREMPDAWPELMQHLSVCPECEEELAIVRKALGGEG